MVSLKPLEILPSKHLSNTRDANLTEETKIQAVESSRDDTPNVMVNGSGGVEEVVEAISKETESINNSEPIKAEQESAPKSDADHSKENGSVSEHGCVQKEEEEEQERAVDHVEVETIGDGLKNRKSETKENLKKPAEIPKPIDLALNQAESSCWHWSYYLIAAALIAFTAISIHVFHDKTTTA